MRRNRATVATALTLVAVSAWAALAQDKGSAGPVVATVGRLSITVNELNERFELARSGYRERTGEALPGALVPTLKRTVLEQIIRARLLTLEAERTGMLVSEQEAEDALRKTPFFNAGGRFNPTQFEAVRRSSPAAFAAALSDMRLRLSGARMEERVARRHLPEEAKLRADIERELTSASIDALVLPFNSFDGRGAEPTEREILDFHKANGHGALIDEAMDIRERLRIEQRAGSSDESLQRLYVRLRDELRGNAARVRYAFFDTSTIRVPQPSDSDLNRYYRGHLADYSTFDAARGEVSQKPFEDVRDHVLGRWLRERRTIEARAAGERVLTAWDRGRRDRKTERDASLLAETPLVAPGSPVDTQRFGALLGDTLSARGARASTGMTDAPGGILVFEIFDARDDFVPAFESIRALLEVRGAEELAAEEALAAKRMFDADPMAFAHDSTVHFSRFVVPLPRPIDVPLTRREVERYHREHIQKYSVAEIVAARHILIAPSGPGAEPEEAARSKAGDLLQRIRAGADFNELAREHSDDLASRDAGGDLGSFGRGLMHPTFEQVVFQMRAGDVSDVVRTPQGYHIIKCTAYEPVQARPLVEVYTNVGFDAAMEKSIVLGRQRADSLMRYIHTPEDGRRIAVANNLQLLRNSKAFGEPGGVPELEAYFTRLDVMKPGELYPSPVAIRGQGHAITWVDSISPPRSPDFNQVEREVIAEYRRREGARALEAKRAEIEQMERNGWSLDSLATLFGGLRHLDAVRAEEGLPGLGGMAQIDSLLFGLDGRRAALQPGGTSAWVALPGGLVRVRLTAVTPPDPSDMAARLERDRRKEQERNMYFYYENLKREFPIRILDAELSATTLPPPTGATGR